jgi:hypothetical protein
MGEQAVSDAEAGRRFGRRSRRQGRLKPTISHGDVSSHLCHRFHELPMSLLMFLNGRLSWGLAGNAPRPAEISDS